MKKALSLAYKARRCNQWPVGAVIVKNHKVIASARNMMCEMQDPTAHAEIIAARRAMKALKAYYLEGCTLFVTLEPCAMCYYTLQTMRITSIICGAVNQGNSANKRLPVIECMFENASSRLLKEYAEDLRSNL